MSEPTDPPPDPFPDVGLRPQIALLLITSLAVVYAVIFVIFGASERTESAARLASLGLAASLLLLSYIDLRTGLLPDLITLPLIAAGIGFELLSGGSWALAIAGAIVGYGVISTLAYIWRYVRGYEGIGLGDAKLLAAGGAWVGVSMLPVILLVASGAGLLGAISVSQKPQRAGQDVAIPFGPALGLGIWVAWCTERIIFG